MSSLDEKEEKEKDPFISEGEESDVDNEDNFSENDYYSSTNNEYKEAPSLPQIECPKQNIETNTKAKRIINTRITYKEFTEKVISIQNPLALTGYDNFDFSYSPDTIFENHQINYTEQFDYNSSRYNVFSKNHHRTGLMKILNEIDWKNSQMKINEAKKVTNAYEDVYEKYFEKHSAYKLANLNYIFQKELITADMIVQYTPVMIVGDNGGFSDYVQWYSTKNGFISKIFVIPEKNNLISSAKFKITQEIKIKSDIDILKDFYDKCDLDDNPNLSSSFLSSISQNVMDKLENYGVNLFIARKFIKYSPDYSQEMKYRKFMLINIILCFELLNKGGYFILKIYDSFSLFTISLIYILYQNFEKITVIKPFSTRPYSASRYVVCEKFIDSKTSILDYLKQFLDKYLEFIKDGKDIPYVLPTSEITKSEEFSSLFLEINSQITEGRIDALGEISHFLKNENIMNYDKMDIKMRCLTLWQIPVMEFDESKLAKNQIHFNNRNRDTHKIKSLDEVANYYENYDKYEGSTKNLIDLLIKGGERKPKKEQKKKEIKKRELTQEEKNKIYDELFPKKKYKKKDKKKDDDDDNKEDNKKKDKKKNDNKKDEKKKHEEKNSSNDNFLNKKRNNNNHQKEPKKEDIKKPKNDGIWKEALKNKHKLESEKIHVNEDIKAKLLLYKKK